MRTTWILPLVVGGLVEGCTRYQYTHGFTTVKMRAEPVTVQPPFTSDPESPIEIEHEISLATNEILLTDETGIGCATLATEANRSGNAYEAAYNAARAGQTVGTVQYEYRVYSPAEFRGISCGGYFRNGSGDADARGVATDVAAMRSTLMTYETDADMWEFGLYIGGTEAIVPEWPWLRWSLDFRLGFGDFEVTKPEGINSFVSSLPDGDVYVTIPLHAGLLVFPDFLYGFGVAADVGADALSWLADQGGVLDKIDLTARAEYAYGTPWFAVGAYGGWQMRHVGWGDMWVKSTGPMVGGYLQLHFDTIFG